MTGDQLIESAPWLVDLYYGKLLEVAREITKEQLKATSDVRYGLNINAIEDLGSRCERHVDDCPLAGVLFVSELSKSDGGQFSVEMDGDTEHITPQRGLFCYSMDGINRTRLRKIIESDRWFSSNPDSHFHRKRTPVFMRVDSLGAMAAAHAEVDAGV